MLREHVKGGTPSSRGKGNSGTTPTQLTKASAQIFITVQMTSKTDQGNHSLIDSGFSSYSKVYAHISHVISLNCKSISDIPKRKIY
jgi:hypothetical protein